MGDSTKPYGMSQSHTPTPKRKSPLPTFVLMLLFGLVGGVAGWYIINSSGETAPEDWIDYVSDAGRYSVNLPSEPDSDAEPLKTKDGEFTMYMVSTQNRRRAYAVSYCDFGSAVMANPRETLNMFMSGGMEGIGGEVERSQEIELEGHPGLEFWATLNDGGLAHYRIYLVNNRLYQQGIIYAEGFEPNPELFFGSFQLLADR